MFFAKLSGGGGGGVVYYFDMGVIRHHPPGNLKILYSEI